MWLPRNGLVTAFIFLWGFSVEAGNFGNLRLGGTLGLGQAGAVRNGVTRVESPLGFSAFVDYSVDSRFTLGAEHVRSFEGGSSSVGFTGVSGKWYFWTPQPQWLVNENDVIQSDILMQKYIVPYAGVAGGFAQASFPKKVNTAEDVLVVGPYVALKGGLEYPLKGRWGARSEFEYATTMGGTGRAESVHLFLGLYYFL